VVAVAQNGRRWRSSCDLARYRPGIRRQARVVELERIFGDVVDLVEVSSTDELARAVESLDVAAVALDASPPGSSPRRSPFQARFRSFDLWRRQRNARRDVDGLFDGYGLLAGSEVVRLRDGELSIT